MDRLRLWGISMLFVIGGNGGNAAAHAIAAECERQGCVCSVVGVPKSIDNDIQLIDRCFGFDTSVEEAQRPLVSAAVEARSSAGVSIVKLMVRCLGWGLGPGALGPGLKALQELLLHEPPSSMRASDDSLTPHAPHAHPASSPPSPQGRQSGFIAMNASMASGLVDVCLIPEIPFALDKLTAHVQSVLDAKSYCVLCVAEGAGQDAMEDGQTGTDASGNPILKDIGALGWAGEALGRRDGPGAAPCPEK